MLRLVHLSDIHFRGPEMDGRSWLGSYTRSKLLLE
jgi:hypothetical protein